MRTNEKITLFTVLAAIAIVYALELFLIVALAVGKLSAGQTPTIFFSKPALLIHFLAIMGIICFLYACFIEPYWIQVNTVRIPTQKLSKTSIRLVHISDLHCDTKPRSEKRLVKLINAAEPDIIAFTGDTLKLHTPKALPLFKDTMKNLKAPLAKFAVRGNVDIWYLPDLDFFDGTAFQVLDANSVKIKKNAETFYITGASCEYPDAFRNVLKDVPDNRFSIFLYHYPDLIEDLENLNVDLYLCGHTHGGQITLPFYGAIITLSKFGKKYESGLHTVGNTILYVNRGIGGHAWSIRFFARPEITIFDIVPKDNQPD